MLFHIDLIINILILYNQKYKLYWGDFLQKNLMLFFMIFQNFHTPFHNCQKGNKFSLYYLKKLIFRGDFHQKNLILYLEITYSFQRLFHINLIINKFILYCL